MKSSKIFGLYLLIFAILVVGGVARFSNAASTDRLFLSDSELVSGATVPTRTPGATVPTRTPNSGGTVPTRTPGAGETIPTRTPSAGETIPTRTPVAGETIPTRTPTTDEAGSSESSADAATGGSQSEGSSGGRGSMIVLLSDSADGDDWVVVEWLAGDGNWYQVDGWRGHINNGQLIWWVAQENLGQGPFRWVVYDDESEAVMLKTSDGFNLPENPDGVKAFSLNW